MSPSSSGRLLIAEKFALVFEPPTVIVQYRAQDTGKRRLRKLRLDAKTVVATPSVEALTQKILRSLPKKLDLATVKSEQVQRLVQRLVDKCRGNTTTTAVVNASVDYNKLGDDDVAAVKKAMDVDFEKNRKRPGDEDFVYDVQVEFDPTDDLGNSWDDD
ncbi:centrosomal protein of 19 kDa [Pycnococcus provasolii]|uniref:Centrosomal protein of 19 kDa n=1 Tax=Pycnococcus provasolii TaxID=41880 RepID=A0A830HU76_9CHLO|nr:centrosomal protein of 19 kDa [Pycnococcus provasolii]